MSDTKQDWIKDWDALQRHYWNGWTEAARQAAGQAAPTMNTPWQQGLEQWSKAAFSSQQQSGIVEKLIENTKNYLGLMQSLQSGVLSQGPVFNSELGIPAWMDALSKAFNTSAIDQRFFNNPIALALRNIPGYDLFGATDRLQAGFAPIFNAYKQETLTTLNMPAFGYAREHQEHYQKMAQAAIEYHDAATRYNALLLKSSQRSFELMEIKLAERCEPGRQLDSLRALYDVWVDAAEEAYAEIALSPEFREAYGAVVNAQMRVRAQMQQEVERIGTDFGMPTRTELNSVHQRVHELRRELKQREEQVTANTDLAKELIALRAEVTALKQQFNVTSTSNSTVKPELKKDVKTSKSTKR